MRDTHPQQVVSLPGAQTTDKLHQWRRVCVRNTLVDVHADLVDAVDKFEIQRLHQVFTIDFILRETVSRPLNSFVASVPNGRYCQSTILPKVPTILSTSIGWCLWHYYKLANKIYHNKGMCLSASFIITPRFARFRWKNKPGIVNKKLNFYG